MGHIVCKSKELTKFSSLWVHCSALEPAKSKRVFTLQVIEAEYSYRTCLKRSKAFVACKSLAYMYVCRESRMYRTLMCKGCTYSIRYRECPWLQLVYRANNTPSPERPPPPHGLQPLETGGTTFCLFTDDYLRPIQYIPSGPVAIVNLWRKGLYIPSGPVAIVNLWRKGLYIPSGPVAIVNLWIESTL